MYFNMSHAHEKLVEKGLKVPCYTVFRNICHRHKTVKHPYKKLKQKIRKIRNRCVARGIMLQIDGSYHVWFGRFESCLITIIDDATGEILFGKFCSAETKDDCIDVIVNVLKTHGKFGILYADKAGVYGGAKREGFAHVLTGLDELGITSIAANSAEAKGRIERQYRTLQDRLIPEMRTRGIIQPHQKPIHIFKMNTSLPLINSSQCNP
ncbi:MAG: hypothetical protein HQK52_20085 [Oligoflexia bacterium]|nr:hypothetical protein [Oligoflexia bacterium]